MKRSTSAAVISVFLASAIAPAAFAKGPPSGGGEETSSNNLSYPAVFPSTGVTLAGTEGAWNLTGVLGNGLSYGCAIPETIGTTTYPNTSCVSTEGVYLHDLDACIAGPCALRASGGRADLLAKERRQRVAGRSLGPAIPASRTADATHLDWGDNLESVSWSASSIIRVETGPFATLAATQTGFQMWHVFGQGTTELWGVHAVSAAQPYVYESPYAFIVTPTARLNMAKLEAGASTCPTEYEPSDFSPVWNSVTSRWSDTFFLRDIPYTAELAISGKFVYGYVWNLRKDPMPAGASSKAGWWRLTFYSPDVLLNGSQTIELVPPILLGRHPAALPTVAAAEGGRRKAIPARSIAR